jgi:hypothetical protein
MTAIDETFEIPRDVVERTQGHLRLKGREHNEGVVLWRGTFEPPRITGVIVPEQVTSCGRFVVPLAERQRIARGLVGSGEVIVAQVHSHPREAFHSPVDDEEAIPRRPGSYSLVVPDFAARESILQAAALFQLEQDGSWREIATEALRLAPGRRGKPRWLIGILRSFGRSRT